MQRPKPRSRNQFTEHPGGQDCLSEGVPYSKKKASAELESALKGVRTLSELLTSLRIDSWDYLVIGDGSATKWTHAAGWASLLVSRDPAERKAFHGGFSCGTNIVAELMAVVLPVLYLTSVKDRLSLKRLHVITDCEYLTQAGPSPGSRKKNRPLWAVIDTAVGMGLRIHWHWTPRDCLNVNKYAHDMANECRHSMIWHNESTANELATKHTQMEQAGPSDFLPSE